MKVYLAPLTLTLVAIATPATAEDLSPGNLRFEGLVQSGTCNLTADDVNRTITLPTVKVSDFADKDSVGDQPFQLTVDCDSDIRDVTFTFSGTPSPPDPIRFANTGTADGLGLWLYSLLNGVRQTLRADGLDRKSGTVREGTLESQATVQVTYN